MRAIRRIEYTLRANLCSAQRWSKKNPRLESATAVEEQNFAGDEWRVDEEGDGGGDVYGCAGALQRGALDEVACQIWRVAGHGDGAGSDGVDAYFWSKRFG